MAIKKTFETMAYEQKVFVPSAYIKVASFQGTKQRITATISIQTEDQSRELLQKTISFEPDLSGENFVKQAYEQMKKLPEYAGGEDC